MSPEKKRKMFQVLGLLHLPGRPGRSFWILASEAPRCGHCNHLGSKSSDGRSLSLPSSFSLYRSAFETNDYLQHTYLLLHTAFEEQESRSSLARWFWLSGECLLRAGRVPAAVWANSRSCFQDGSLTYLQVQSPDPSDATDQGLSFSLHGVHLKDNHDMACPTTCDQENWSNCDRSHSTIQNLTSKVMFLSLPLVSKCDTEANQTMVWRSGGKDKWELS